MTETKITAAIDGAVAALHHIRGLRQILLALSVASDSVEPVTPDAGLYLTLAGIADQVSERMHAYMLAKEGMTESDLLAGGEGEKEARQ